jgi:hypothetical protein
VIFHSTKFHSNPPKSLRRVAKTKYLKKKRKALFSGHNSLKKKNWTVLPLQYAHLYNVIFHCTEFHQNPHRYYNELWNHRGQDDEMRTPCVT